MTRTERNQMIETKEAQGWEYVEQLIVGKENEVMCQLNKGAWIKDGMYIQLDGNSFTEPKTIWEQ